MRTTILTALTAASILGLAAEAEAQGLGQQQRTAAAVFHQQTFDIGSPTVAGDVSVQCGAFRDKPPFGLGPEDEAVPFTAHLTMSSSQEFGGHVPATYHFGYIGGVPAAEVDAVNYSIGFDGGPLSMSLAAGSDLNLDAALQVTFIPEGAFGFVNTDGQMSIHLSDPRAKPHPAVDPTGKKFCTTTPAPASNTSTSSP
jgi:hypothetical protein